MKPNRRESEVKSEVGRSLSRLGVLWFRMNVGAFRGMNNGKQRFVRFGYPGMADILAFPGKSVLWIETKRERGGVQSKAQQLFESIVKAQGHDYIVATNAGDVLEWMKGTEES